MQLRHQSQPSALQSRSARSATRTVARPAAAADSSSVIGYHLLAQASRVRRGANHANNITQKARTLLTEDADDAFCIDRDACFGSCMLLRQQRPLRGALHSPHAAGAAREIVVAMPPREGRGGGAVADVADCRGCQKRIRDEANPL